LTAEAINKDLKSKLGLISNFKPYGNTGKLPVFLTQRFTLLEGVLYGRDVILAIKRTKLKLTPFEIKKSIDSLTEKIGKQVVYCVETINSVERTRLIYYDVQFIVPGKQIFLPQFIVVLNETNKVEKVKRKFLTPAAQCVLFHMINSPESTFIITELAENLGYSKMTVSRAFYELEDFKLIKTYNRGRTIVSELSEPKEIIWGKISNFIMDPKTGVRFVKVLHQDFYDYMVISGLTALTEISMINDDSLKSYACTRQVFTSLTKDKIIEEVPFREDADVLLELWAYNPGTSDQSGQKMVDVLSLYASLKDETDERVSIALSEIIERKKW
jgi:DNA-binding transcriptional ArsR family regulator